MVQRTIALVADCDDTLAPDTTAQLLGHFGVDARSFYQGKVAPLVSVGWDPALAYMHEILKLVEEGPLADLTLTRIQEIGQNLDLFPGVPDVFHELRSDIENDDEYSQYRIKVRFYVISGGIEDLIRASLIGQAVNQVWGCNFEYDDDGLAMFPKACVSFTEKTRFLYNIQKDFASDKYKNKPYIVNVQMRNGERRIPFRRMVYLGDGPSDIPCMSVMNQYDGYVIGLIETENPGKIWELGYGRRANVTVPQDYRKSGPAYNVLKESLSRIAEDIVREVEFRDAGRVGPSY